MTEAEFLDGIRNALERDASSHAVTETDVRDIEMFHRLREYFYTKFPTQESLNGFSKDDYAQVIIGFSEEEINRQRVRIEYLERAVKTLNSQNQLLVNAMNKLTESDLTLLDRRKIKDQTIMSLPVDRDGMRQCRHGGKFYGCGRWFYPNEENDRSYYCPECRSNSGARRIERLRRRRRESGKEMADWASPKLQEHEIYQPSSERKETIRAIGNKICDRNEESLRELAQTERQRRIEQQPKEERVTKVNVLLTELDRYGTTHFPSAQERENKEE